MSADNTPMMNRSEAFEASEDVPTNPMTQPTIGDVITTRYSRRSIMRGLLGVSAIGTLMQHSPALASLGAKSFDFPEIEHGVDETHHVADGYSADVLIRWGDPVEPGAPAFDPENQTAEAQSKQFGYNNDYIGYAALPFNSDNADHGLLCVNHEYTNEEVMFPGVGVQHSREVAFAGMTKDLVDIEMAAHGCSVIEVQRDGNTGKWAVVPNSRYARRITALGTEMAISGPAAGHDRMKTSADPTGMRVIGTINNCAGGMTPWGTYLAAEENFHGYFWGDAEGHPEEANYKRYGVPSMWYAWGKFHDRFDINKEPNEANRFGWVVEIDPYDPTSTPIKRTALGRFKHEGAESIINKDGRVVLYMGDDQRFDYLYKFITHGRYNPNDRDANRDLLDSGTLFVARFGDDGTMEWRPLVWGTGPLTPENGFMSQADVLIETRRAADLLEATPMDRPEDVEANAVTGKVYCMLTNNTRRTEEQVDAVNPRADNTFGHILEMTPPDMDHGALTYAWDILVKCGDPSVAEVGAQWNPETSENGWFAAPDNCAVDARGRLWITTDQGSNWAKSGTADGMWAMETEGDRRGTGQMFFRVPIGAELCGPKFTPDDRTVFLAIQHPATDGTKNYPGFEKVSTYEDPATRWPDFDDAMPPRPSVVVITKNDGGRIG